MKGSRGYLVGITGNSGCGQSTAASFAGPLCSGICSLDILGHRMLEKRYVLHELSVIFKDLDLQGRSQRELRSMIGERVFGDPSLLKRLNSVLHPRMKRWVEAAASRLSRTRGIWVLEGALIYELELERHLDTVIVVSDTLERSAGRLAERDGAPAAEMKRRWDYQLPIEEKAGRADHVVHNSENVEYLQRQILDIFGEILKNI